jgi:hypothetical protein
MFRITGNVTLLICGFAATSSCPCAHTAARVPPTDYKKKSSTFQKTLILRNGQALRSISCAINIFLCNPQGSNAICPELRNAMLLKAIILCQGNHPLTRQSQKSQYE